VSKLLAVVSLASIEAVEVPILSVLVTISASCTTELTILLTLFLLTITQ